MNPLTKIFYDLVNEGLTSNQKVSFLGPRLLLLSSSTMSFRAQNLSCLPSPRQDLAFLIIHLHVRSCHLCPSFNPTSISIFYLPESSIFILGNILISSS